LFQKCRGVYSSFTPAPSFAYNNPIVKNKSEKYDLILVGSGFASAFFLHKYLEQKNDRLRVLILERGKHDTHAWRIKNRAKRQPHDVVSSMRYQDTIINRNPNKEWAFDISLGGGSNVWWGCAPRFLPSDFNMRTRFGVAEDWPLSYEDLEGYYCQAEEIMQISGEQANTIYPMSRPYPQPPHRFNAVDEVLKKAHPGLHFAMPCARRRISTIGHPQCCAAGICSLCPVNAKFTIQDGIPDIFKDPRVTLSLESEVESLDTENGLARGVVYKKNGKSNYAAGEVIALGANPIFNPAILIKSGLEHPLLGKYISEQYSINVMVDLNGLDNYDGSTSITGHGYMLYDGAHRKERSACLIENWNVPQIRIERGRYTQTALFKFIFDEIPRVENHMLFNKEQAKPEIVHGAPSDYVEKGKEYVLQNLGKILAGLPIEKLRGTSPLSKTEGHILGTTRMARNSHEGVIDQDLIHHKVRNLLVLGGGAFPSLSPSNPSPTIAALSLRSADRLLSAGYKA